MNKMTFWSVAASLFCSLAVSDGVFQVSRGVQLAAMGNPEAVQNLAAVVVRMGGQSALPAVATPAGHAVVPVTFSSEDGDFAAMQRWAEQNPHSLHFDNGLSAAFGLGDRRISINQRGFYDSEERLGYAFIFATVDGRDLWFLQKNVGDVTLLWQLARDGSIVRTVRCQGDSKVVPTGDYMADFRQARAFMIDRVQRAQAVVDGNQSKS